MPDRSLADVLDNVISTLPPGFPFSRQITILRAQVPLTPDEVSANFWASVHSNLTNFLLLYVGVDGPVEPILAPYSAWVGRSVTEDDVAAFRTQFLAGQVEHAAADKLNETMKQFIQQEAQRNVEAHQAQQAEAMRQQSQTLGVPGTSEAPSA